ncbi:GlcG/HbpS family heme-binding protein [Serratia fonticola]|uniref:GlcG/HbpS family heme-binding protein n=1 Tax=Serratia fonticola TaxID=47917 RepID=UPI001377DF1D|nr:heme-binding protein [Serratia fonticola]NCG52845.1 heme-binding protein [Serratia fonticola]
MKRIISCAILFSSMLSFTSTASGILTEKNLSLELADKLAQSAIQACSANNYNVAVTVVDRAGIPLVIKRMDNAGPHTVEASQMKAFTALTTKNPTENVMKNAQANAGAANLRDIPGFLLLAGGVPVKSGEEVVGAIGVGGAPGGHFDQQCALTALEKVLTK